MQQDVYLYSQHVPTLCEWVLYYFKCSGVVIQGYCYWTLLLNRLRRPL